MATLTIRKLDDSIKQSLRIQAAHHGVSMEEEARRILQSSLSRKIEQDKLGYRINQHFVQAGGVNEKIIPERSMPRPAPDLTELRD